MRTMPKPPRTEDLDHETAIAALQKWLWACVAAGWDPLNPANGRWSHEDNMEAVSLGWMISQPPGSQHLDLFSLRQGVKPAQIMSQIVAMATINPVCARAVVMLSAQKLKFPDVKFAFDNTTDRIMRSHHDIRNFEAG